jgi:hypothetical protein
MICVDGLQQTGEASCENGQWVCAQAPCDAGACDGALIEVCNGGVISASCCPAGAPCLTALPFCDLGGGACIAGTTCAALDGGGSCATIEASSYNQVCSADIDCAPVYQGSVCSGCFCPTAAINRAALPAYQKDFAASGPHPGGCECPLIPAPVCNAGVCTLP